ncbi:MAG: hypothetical protein QXF06_01235 [Archaeoglobaceae archaeon]
MTRCKICRSPYREQIDQMLVDNRAYNEIIASFPELCLNKVNLSNHKRHIYPSMIEEARRKYDSHVNELASKVLDEITALDSVIAKAYSIFSTFDFETKPRVVEVWTNTLLRAIKLKNEILVLKSPQNEFEKILENLWKEDGNEEGRI